MLVPSHDHTLLAHNVLVLMLVLARVHTLLDQNVLDHTELADTLFEPDQTLKPFPCICGQIWNWIMGGGGSCSHLCSAWV